MIKKLKKWLCEKLGHRFNPVSLCMFEIEHEATNRKDFENRTIECERCGMVFGHKFDHSSKY